MEERFDTQTIIERVNDLAKEIRKSDAYPALVGGIAGGIAGALIAAMIAGRMSSRLTSPPAASVDGKGKERGWAVRDVIELVTIVAALAKQARDWYQQERAKK